MSMRWLYREESYGKIKNNHYLRINIKDAEPLKWVELGDGGDPVLCYSK